MRARYIIVSGLLLIIVGLSYFVYLQFFTFDAEQVLQAGRESYGKGVEVLESGKADQMGEAILRMDEAVLRAKKVLDYTEPRLRRKQGLDEPRVEELERQGGEAFWLKAQALRDYVFAKRAEKGEPLPQTPDVTEGEMFRSFLTARLADPVLGEEAIACLRQAAVRLPGDVAVQEESLRFETQWERPAWAFVKERAEDILVADPQSPTAHFALARYYFDQPYETGDKSGLPRAAKDRSAGSVDKAREHLAAAQQAPNLPLWRSRHLEAEIQKWLWDEAERKFKPAQAKQHEALYRKLLLEGEDNVIQQAKAGQGFDRLGRWDVQGVLDLHLMALRLLVGDVRDKSRAPESLLPALDATLDLCVAGPKKSSTFREESAAMTAVQAVALTQPYLSARLRAEWTDRVNRAVQLVDAAAAAKQGTPALFAATAGLLEREAAISGKQGDPAQERAFRAKAMKTLEEGFAVAAARDLKGPALADLHAQAAALKLVFGEKSGDIAEHLTGLQETGDPKAAVYAQLYAGVAAEREGRLEEAKEHLERVLRSDETDLHVRAHSVLANIHFALGQPDKALSSLQALYDAYANIDRLPPDEKAWVMEFTRGKEGIISSLVVANLGAAQQRAAEYTKDNPGRAVPFEKVRFLEEKAKGYLAELAKAAPGSAAELQARLAYAGYLFATGRRPEAKLELELLHKNDNFKDNLTLLQTEVQFTLAEGQKEVGKKGEPGKAAPPDAATVAAVEKQIDAFLRENPRHTGGHLFKVLWLLRTDRPKEAEKYLEDFPGEKGELYYAVVAQLAARQGDRGELQKIPDQFRNSGVEILIALMAPTAGEQQRELAKLRDKYDENGITHCWQATLDLNAGKYPEAVEGFEKGLAYTRVRPWARSGLQRALLGMAAQDPKKTREKLAGMIKESPDEPTLYLVWAFASERLDEVGEPIDSWKSNSGTMGAALNEWERLLPPAAGNKAQGPLTQAEMWTLANRTDEAYKQVKRALKLDPGNAGALALGIRLALDTPLPDRLKEAEAWAEELARKEPDQAATYLLRGQLDEYLGKPAAAVSAYEAALGKQKDNAEAHLRLIDLLKKQKEPAKAAAAADRWLADVPDSYAAARVKVALLAGDGHVAEASKLADAFIARQLDRLKKQWQEQKDKAEGKIPEGDREKALQQTLDQTEEFLQLELARGFVQGEAWAEAERRMRDMLKAEPDAVGPRIILGDMYIRRGMWQEARDVYEQVYKIHPRNLIASNNLAWLLATKFGDAARAYDIAQPLRVSPASGKVVPGDRLRADYLDTLGVIYSGLKDPSKAREMLELFEAAERRHPEDPRVLLYLGRAYANLDRGRDAASSFDAAVAMARRTPEQVLDAEGRQRVIEEATEAKTRLARQ